MLTENENLSTRRETAVNQATCGPGNFETNTRFRSLIDSLYVHLNLNCNKSVNAELKLLSNY